MKIPRIYQQQPLSLEQTIILSPEAAVHVAVVLNMRPNEEIILFNGDSFEYKGIITSVAKKTVSVYINNKEENSLESKHKIHLAQAIIKGDRMEWIIQKAVELGISSITPLITDRCIVRVDQDRLEKKLKQWQLIAIGACEQSGRNEIPKINPPDHLGKYVSSCTANMKFMFHPESSESSIISTHGDADCAFVIGPEGGFTEKEIDMASQNAFNISKLGNRILRAETAAIAAIIYLQIKLGEF